MKQNGLPFSPNLKALKDYFKDMSSSGKNFGRAILLLMEIFSRKRISGLLFIICILSLVKVQLIVFHQWVSQGWVTTDTYSGILNYGCIHPYSPFILR